MIRSATGLRAVFLAVLSTIAPESAVGAVFEVTKTADGSDGACDADCSLREAVIAANADAAADVIMLPAGLYTLQFAGAEEDAAQLGDLDILEPVTIQGADAATTIVDGGGLDRVFHVDADERPVVFRDLTIQGGAASGTGENGRGGGVYANQSLVTIERCVVKDNAAAIRGGGVEVSLGGSIPDGASLDLLWSTISGNTAAGAGGGGGLLVSGRVDVRVIGGAIADNMHAGGTGGGAYFSGPRTLLIVGSSFTGNEAATGGGISINQSFGTLIRDALIEGNSASNRGGGLVGNLFAAPIVIEASRIRDNTADNNGGGIYNDGNAILITDSEISGNSSDFGGGINTIRTNLTIRGSTISGNTANTLGGGVQVAFGAHLIENSTITGNTVVSATGSNGGIGGGGLSTSVSTAIDVTLTNVTIADNVTAAGGEQIFCGTCGASSFVRLRNTVISGSATAPNCASRFNAGPVTSEGGNVSNDASCNLTEATDQADVADVMLGAPASDGGPTKTMPIAAGSPAAGAAVQANCPLNDQRGFQRDDDCDAGAYEAGVSFEGFGCPKDADEARKQLGYVVEEILAIDAGDVVFCLGGIAGAA